ncbi:zinc ribbon domain-containing protein [Virgibacillus natechei]
MFCSNCGNSLDQDDKFCSKCGRVVKEESINEITVVEEVKTDEIETEDTTNKSENTEAAIGCGFIVIIVIVIIILFASCGSGGSSDDPSYYDTENPDDMTNKEMEQFIEWKLKENEREYDNAPFNE